jgi:hypothetical protein
MFIFSFDVTEAGLGYSENLSKKKQKRKCVSISRIKDKKMSI